MPFDDNGDDDDGEEEDSDEFDVEACSCCAATKLDRRELVSSTLDLSVMGRRMTDDPLPFIMFLSELSVSPQGDFLHSTRLRCGEDEPHNEELVEGYHVKRIT